MSWWILGGVVGVWGVCGVLAYGLYGHSWPHFVGVVAGLGAALSIFIFLAVLERRARHGSRQGTQNPHGGAGGVAAVPSSSYPAQLALTTYHLGAPGHYSITLPALQPVTGHYSITLPALQPVAPYAPPRRISTKVETALVAGPIIAYRAWAVSGNYLTGIGSGHGQLWHPGQPLKAVCLASGPSHANPPPLSKCSCGIYALKRTEIGMEDSQVFGKVALWGTVIEHEGGYRAEYAYPFAFIVPTVTLVMPGFPQPPSEILALAERYGIRVESSVEWISE
jgi:hypothetical protein